MHRGFVEYQHQPKGEPQHVHHLMPISDKKSILITGASKGLGRAIAEASLAEGHRVIATSRQSEALSDLQSRYGDQMMIADLDVTNQGQIKVLVDRAAAAFERIDVLINNAGFGMLGAIEEFSADEVARQFATNVYGPLWLIQAVLPYMRAQRSGHIINISSVAGFVGYAGSGLYAGSKHALEGISQGLQKEVAAMGIKVTVVNPGPFRTNFAGTSLGIASRKISAYAETVHARQANLQTRLHGNQPGDPVRAAHAILSLLVLDEPPFTLPMGEVAYEEIPERLQRTLHEISQYASIGRPTDFSDEETASL